MAEKKAPEVADDNFILLRTDDMQIVKGWHFDHPGVLLQYTRGDIVSYAFKPGAAIYPQIVNDKIVGGDLTGGEI